MSEPGVKLRRRSGRQAPTSNYAEYIVEKSDEEDEEDEDLDKGAFEPCYTPSSRQLSVHQARS